MYEGNIQLTSALFVSCLNCVRLRQENAKYEKMKFGPLVALDFESLDIKKQLL